MRWQVSVYIWMFHTRTCCQQCAQTFAAKPRYIHSSEVSACNRRRAYTECDYYCQQQSVTVAVKTREFSKCWYSRPWRRKVNNKQICYSTWPQISKTFSRSCEYLRSFSSAHRTRTPTHSNFQIFNTHRPRMLRRMHIRILPVLPQCRMPTGHSWFMLKGKGFPYSLRTERWARSWSRCTGSQPTGDLRYPTRRYYFPPGLRLPSQPQRITALWLVLILPFHGG